MRISYAQASWIVLGFYLRLFKGNHNIPEPYLVPDGEKCWAFWLDEQDTTSYIHEDGSVEWYGTQYEPE